MLVYGLHGLLAELVGRPAASQRRLGPSINDVTGFSKRKMALTLSLIAKTLYVTQWAQIIILRHIFNMNFQSFVVLGSWDVGVIYGRPICKPWGYIWPWGRDRVGYRWIWIVVLPYTLHKCAFCLVSGPGEIQHIFSFDVIRKVLGYT